MTVFVTLPKKTPVLDQWQYAVGFVIKVDTALGSLNLGLAATVYI